MELTADAALAALGAVAPGPSDSLKVQPVGKGVIWTGTQVDDHGLPLAGGCWLIGPDSKTYAISSNPGIHDFDLAVRLLELAYRDSLAEFLDPDRFGERLRQMTERRSQDLADFVSDLRGRSLRGRSTRSLP